MKKYLVLILTALLCYNGYWLHKLYNFDKQVQKWAKFKDLQLDCLEALDSERNQQITDLSNKRLKPIHILWIYNHNIPACEKLAKERCWEWDGDDPVNMEHCKDSMNSQDYAYWKKTGKNPWKKEDK